MAQRKWLNPVTQATNTTSNQEEPYMPRYFTYVPIIWSHVCTGYPKPRFHPALRIPVRVRSARFRVAQTNLTSYSEYARGVAHIRFSGDSVCLWPELQCSIQLGWTTTVVPMTCRNIKPITRCQNIIFNPGKEPHSPQYPASVCIWVWIFWPLVYTIPKKQPIK